MFEEFKKFIMRGNVMDMAVGVIIGAAFGKVASSFVSDILMGPLGMLMGRVDFSNLFIYTCGNAGRGTEGRTSCYRLRSFHQWRYRLSDCRLCSVPHDSAGQ